jgi:hypothetical protein
VIDHYDWAGGREAMLRFGPDEGPVVIVALPLFEEANRTRTFAITLCRALGEHGLGSAIPDLPGQGESLVATERARIADMRHAFSTAVAQFEGSAYVIAIRSGALIDALAFVSGRWHFAPQEGQSLLRDLSRMRQAATGRPFEPNLHLSGDEAIEFGGNLISSALLSELAGVSPMSTADRTIRLASDPKLADRKVDAGPFWRRAEPYNDPDLAALLAEDIAHWIATCVD